MALVKFYTCTQAQYNALQTKVEGNLYFTTDTKRIYKGETLYGGSFEYCANNLPATGSVGTLYFQASTGKTFEWDSTESQFVEKYLPITSDAISSTSSANTVSTSKAVYDAVHAEATQRAYDDGILSGAIDVINGSDTTAGSIAKAVKDAKDELAEDISDEATQRAYDDGILSGAINTLNGDNQTAGSVAKAVKDAKDAIEAVIGEGFDSTNTVKAATTAEATQRAADDQVLSGAIDTLNGNANTAGSVAKAVKDAKDALSGAIGGEFDSTNNVKAYIDGINTALDSDINYVSGVVQTINGNGEGSFKAADAAISGAIGGTFDAEHTVADAIAALDAAAISITAAENNAIEVTSSGEGGVDKTVGLKINANDKFLSQTADGLSATFTLVKKAAADTAESNAAEYYIADKNGNAVGETINVPKDQFLQSATFVQGSGSGDDKLQLTFITSTGANNVVDIPLSGLFDEYEAGAGIALTPTASGIEISGVIDNASESFLTVGADGFKLAGVQTAINTGDEAISGAIGSGFDSTKTVKKYVDDIQTTISGQIGTGFGSGTTSGTVAEYINTRIEALASTTTTGLAGKLDDVATGHADEIIIAKADGEVQVSGKSVGGATIAAEPTANTVATEAAVSAFVDTKIEDALSASLLWNTL